MSDMVNTTGTSTSGFQDLSIPAIIDTDQDDFIENFYKPLLSEAATYKRGVGYFTAGWLAKNAQGMAAFAANGGTAKWITSPQLSEADWKAIQEGDRARRNKLLHEYLQDQVTTLERELRRDTRNALAWLIAEGILDLRFAVPSEDSGGEFHDKWGVFVDNKGNRVAFHGSQNDSAQGFRNYESFDIFCDWEGEREARRVTLHDNRFDKLWNDTAEGIDTFGLPDSIHDNLVRLRETDLPPFDDETNVITLREYQESAVDVWKANGRRGMLEMATGTGKTYTAIGAMDELLRDRSNPVAVVISVPYTHLANQWAESLSEWGYEQPRMLYGSANSDWKGDLSRLLSDMSIGVREDTIFITTHTTFASDYFKNTIQSTDVETFLIVDEVHGVGSEHRREALLEAYDSRLGLSATPTRYYDEQGTKVLKQFFEGIVFELGLSDAIPDYLTKYEYYPHIVEMTEEELAEYGTLSKQLASEWSKENPDHDLIERLLMKRSGLIKSAEEKLYTFRSVIDNLKRRDAADHLLVYTNHNHIDEAQEILNEMGLIQHRFTNEENDEERDRLLTGFADGKYDALVAMKCLDEGVDVPSTRRAILLSSSQNPKQFIQRRGRVLRKHEESGKEQAEIHDLIVVPTLNPDRTIIDSERNILKRELERFEEFAETAVNEIEAKNRIQPIRTTYEL
jgi:superfamily II DNA or RNA helicase